MRLRRHRNRSKVAPWRIGEKSGRHPSGPLARLFAGFTGVIAVTATLVVVIQTTEALSKRAEWRSPMPSPRNTSLSGERTIETVLGVLEQHKERLCRIVESDDTTPEDKYEALIHLASLTGILTSVANG